MNVLLVVIDQLRADVLRGGLAAFAPTPNLDALASASAVFADHHTVTAPCGPARASLLTGQYAMNHRAIRNGAPLLARSANLATEARKLGYEPLLFGYTDIQPDPADLAPRDPARRSYTQVIPGFVEVVEMREEAWRWLAHLRAHGYDVPDAGAPDFDRLYRPEGGVLGGPALYRAEDSDTAFLTDRFLEQMDVRKASPWFALLAYIRPHPPLVAPAPYHAAVDPGRLPPPAAPGPDHPFVRAYFSGPGATGLYHGFDGDHARLDPATTARLRAIYLGLVMEVDRHVGRVLDWLEATGQAERTLVVVTADHGDMLGDRGMWGKHTVFAEASHVPLIIRDPLGGAATAVGDPTESVDVAPTVLDWLGARPPASMDGRSLLPCLRGERPADPRRETFFEVELGDPEAPTRYERAWRLPARRCRAAVLADARWRYVSFGDAAPPMLFDLATDPGAARDVAPDPAYAAARIEMAERLLAHRMRFAAEPPARIEQLSYDRI